MEHYDLDTLKREYVLQETDSALVEKVRTPAGDVLVLKRYASPGPSFVIETAVLKLLNKCSFEALAVPRIVDIGERYLLMSFVAREVHTRDSILERDWQPGEVDVLCRAIQEFQSISLPSECFTFRQRWMGWAYPVCRAALTFGPLWRMGVLKPGQIRASMILALQYLMIRPLFRNVTTHYDLTTLNCAFTPDKRVSILDFEFSYFKGDPLFDVLYFVTIPPQAIQDWNFQRDTVARYLKDANGPCLAARCRFILLLCCLVRVAHFREQERERNEYLRSLEVLCSGKQFQSWWKTLTSCENADME